MEEKPKTENSSVKLFQLYFGDCLEVMHRLVSAGLKVDAVITDPPYGTTQCRWDSVISLHGMWSNLRFLRNPKTAVLLFGSEPFSSFLRISNIKEFKYDWVWDKKLAPNPLIARYAPLRVYEVISVFYAHHYYPQMQKGEKRFKGGTKARMGDLFGRVKSASYRISDQYHPRAIIELSNADRLNKVHPTQKPVELIEYLVKTYTKENDLVLDFTMGSGTTGVACGNLNRRFIGIENDLKYFSVAKERIEEAYQWGSKLEPKRKSKLKIPKVKNLTS